MKNPEAVKDCALRLRVLRESVGLRQLDLAKKVGVSESMISRIESAERVPDLDLLTSLAAALGTTTAALTTEPERRGRPKKATP